MEDDFKNKYEELLRSNFEKDVEIVRLRSKLKEKEFSHKVEIKMKDIKFNKILERTNKNMRYLLKKLGIHSSKQ
jgi:hypothetical protein